MEETGWKDNIKMDIRNGYKIFIDVLVAQRRLQLPFFVNIVNLGSIKQEKFVIDCENINILGTVP